MNTDFEKGLIHAEVQKQAKQVGVLDVTALQLMDMSQIHVINGEVYGAKEAVESFKQRKPAFFKENGTPTGSSKRLMDGIKPGSREAKKITADWIDSKLPGGPRIMPVTPVSREELKKRAADFLSRHR